MIVNPAAAISLKNLYDNAVNNEEILTQKYVYREHRNTTVLADFETVHYVKEQSSEVLQPFLLHNESASYTSL